MALNHFSCSYVSKTEPVRGEAVKSFTFKECLFLIPVSTLFLKFLNGRVKFYKLRQGRGWGDIFSQSLIVIN